MVYLFLLSPFCRFCNSGPTWLQKEPEIWDAIRFGALLENVVFDQRTGAASIRLKRWGVGGVCFGPQQMSTVKRVELDTHVVKIDGDRHSQVRWRLVSGP